jgi:hypothetical protein
MAAIVESPTKRTLGFCRGKVVVVVLVVVVVEVSMVVSTTVDVVVVVAPSVLVPESAPETDDPMLTANAALNKPAINRIVNLFITLTTCAIQDSFAGPFVNLIQTCRGSLNGTLEHPVPLIQNTALTKSLN